MGKLPHVDGRVEFIDDLDAYNLLEHIFEGHQACQAAVFVDDQHEMLTGFQEAAKKPIDAKGLGNEVDGAHELLEPAIELVFSHGRQNIATQDHSDYIVRIVVEDGYTAVVEDAGQLMRVLQFA